MVQHFLGLSAASDFRRNRSVSSSRNNNQPGGRSFFWLTTSSRCFVSYLAAFVAGLLTTILVQQSTAIYHSSAGFHTSAANGAGGGGNDCVVSLGRYQGPQYVHPTQTVQGRGRCLVESKFLKVQQHSVQFPPSNAGTDEKSPPRIDDWIWIDYHDRINFLIEVAAPTASHDSSHQNQPRHNAEPHFFMFQQTKYALEGRASLAIVGGLVEPGEDPAVAARREVAEEAGQHCAQWHGLGRFRTDVNRGLGWTHTYLARDCTTTIINNNNDSTVTADEVVGAADTERQDVMIMSLSEVRKALQAGEFLKIQWTATIALAMLYYEQHDDG